MVEVEVVARSGNQGSISVDQADCVSRVGAARGKTVTRDEQGAEGLAEQAQRGLLKPRASQQA